MGRSIILVLETRIEKINEQCQNEQCVSENELRKTVSCNRYEYAQFASLRILHFSGILIFMSKNFNPIHTFLVGKSYE